MTPKQIENYWKKVGPPDSNGCHPWLGCQLAAGYGRFGVIGGLAYATRVAVFLDGRDPGQLCVMHKCDNPQCVNPDHLDLGTHADNSRDRDQKGRSGTVKLSEAAVLYIRAHGVKGSNGGRNKDTGNIKHLAEQFGVSSILIYKILNRTIWKHI